MSNTKSTMLDELASELTNLDEVNVATRVLYDALQSREAEPYIGILAGQELNIVEDSTHIRWLLEVDLIMIQRGDDIEKLVDAVKTAIYAPISIGALSVKVEGTQEVALIEMDGFSSTRMVLDITYVSAKAGF